MKFRFRARACLIGVLAGVTVLAGCGRSLSQATSSAGNINPTADLVDTTAAGTKPVSTVTWALYRDVNSLDPAFAFDYPENTAISLMCESLLLQKPGGAITSGLATLATPNQTTLVFTINPKAAFWDGHPVTPADVVYSLQRQETATLGGFYSTVFNRVKSIAATGPKQVTITLTKPDYWLAGELASMPGVIIEKSYAIKQGKKYGTAAGGIMCTGAYEFKSWTVGSGVTAVASPHYWNGATPKVAQIILKGVADNNAFTAGLETGAINGSYSNGGIPTLARLKASSAVSIYQGPGWSSDAMIISATKGPAANPVVRNAISLALDRKSIINDEYKGAALMPKWLANPGVFGYGQATFDKLYAQSPTLAQNIAEAKQLIKQAGATGQTITIGTSNEIAGTAYEVGTFQQAATEIGLKVVLHSVSAQNFINFFTDPAFRKGIDMFPTVNYGDFADPATLLNTLALAGGSQNYDNYSSPQMTTLLDDARGAANPDVRATYTAQAEELAVKQMLWIPVVQPTQVLLLSKNLTGATASFAYMFAPWANDLGGK